MENGTSPWCHWRANGYQLRGENSGHGSKRYQTGRTAGSKKQDPMKIITYNVRGLGRGVKWPAIRRMATKQNIDMLCIQETKKEFFD